jgi:hypothetical protein
MIVTWADILLKTKDEQKRFYKEMIKVQQEEQTRFHEELLRAHK